MGVCFIGPTWAEPIATADGEAPGTSLQVQELKVSNGTVMLKFTLVNDGAADFEPDSLADKDVDKADYHSVSGVYLIDSANKKNIWWCTTRAIAAFAAAGAKTSLRKAAPTCGRSFPRLPTA